MPSSNLIGGSSPLSSSVSSHDRNLCFCLFFYHLFFLFLYLCFCSLLSLLSLCPLSFPSSSVSASSSLPQSLLLLFLPSAHLSLSLFLCLCFCCFFYLLICLCLSSLAPSSISASAVFSIFKFWFFPTQAVFSLRILSGLFSHIAALFCLFSPLNWSVLSVYSLYSGCLSVCRFPLWSGGVWYSVTKQSVRIQP